MAAPRHQLGWRGLCAAGGGRCRARRRKSLRYRPAGRKGDQFRRNHFPEAKILYSFNGNAVTARYADIFLGNNPASPDSLRYGIALGDQSGNGGAASPGFYSLASASDTENFDSAMVRQRAAISMAVNIWAWTDLGTTGRRRSRRWRLCKTTGLSNVVEGASGDALSLIWSMSP